MKKLLLFLPILLMGTFISCDDDDDGDDMNMDIRLVSTDTHGDVLVDKDGNTLYFFSDDYTGTTSECSGGCLDAWPIFHVESPSIGAGLNADDFGSIQHPNGEMMTTYKGWPLYYFAQDTEAGEINGDGVNDVWFVAKPDYDVMYVRAQLTGRDSDGNETDLVINGEGDYVEGVAETFYIVDDRGNTLYAFTPDQANTNTFTQDDDASSDRNMLWPVAQIDATVVPSVLDAADFGTIDVFGWTQMTYKNRPIYYFGQDQNRGDNYGVGFPAPGVWPIVNTNTTAL